MGTQSANGNVGGDFARVSDGENPSIATIMSMYRAMEDAFVDARNSGVMMRLGGEESSSSSSDSESSDPYSEPSPPKSIPKPGSSTPQAFGFSKVSRLSSKPSASSTVIHEGPGHVAASGDKNPTALAAPPANRFGFSSVASTMSFSSSLGPTEGTTSLSSSLGSVKVAAAASSIDEGKLSVAHLTSAIKSSEDEKASEATTKLPPKLAFSLKPAAKAAVVATAAVRVKPGEGGTGVGKGNLSSSSGSAPASTMPVFAIGVADSFACSQTSERAQVQIMAGRTELKPRRASLPTSKIWRFDSTPGFGLSSRSNSTSVPTPVFTFGAVRLSDAPTTPVSSAAPRMTEVGHTSSTTSAAFRSEPTAGNDTSTESVHLVHSSTDSSVIPNLPSLAPTSAKRATARSGLSQTPTSSNATQCTPSTETLDPSITPRSTNLSPPPSASDVWTSDTRNKLGVQGVIGPSINLSKQTKQDVSTAKCETIPALGTSIGLASQEATASTSNAATSKVAPTKPSLLLGRFETRTLSDQMLLPTAGTGFSFGCSGGSPSSSASIFPPHQAVSAYTTLTSVTLEISDASRIASGSTGSIYQASSGFTKLAVKVVDKPTGKKASIRFEREMVNLRNLPEHPCLVRHYGCMNLADASTIGLITELVFGGQTMHARLHNPIRLLDERGKLRVLLQISDALAHLHSHGVSHRDLSLKHVLHSFASSPETIKLIGFGLPTLRASPKSRNSTSLTNEWMGFSPQYASPEVLRGELSYHDNDGWMKSDIFSFAVLMAELLTDEIPWEGESLMYIINAVAKRGDRALDVSDLRVLGKKYPELEEIIHAAWHEDPGCRLTAKDLHKKLEFLFDRAGYDYMPESDLDPFARLAKTFQTEAGQPQSPSTVSSSGCAVNSRTPNPSKLASHPPSADVFAEPVRTAGDTSDVSTAAGVEDPLPSSPPLGLRFEQVQPAPQLSFKIPAVDFFSISKQGSARSPSEGLNRSNTSTHPAFGEPLFSTSSSFMKSPSASPYSSLPSLTITISEKMRIATGNRGVVYRASSRNQQVAVKVVSKPKTRVACSLLDREIVALKNLPDHAHLVRHYGSTALNDGKELGIITDFVFGGEAIEARLHRSALQIKEGDKHRMLLQIIDAVAFLHAHGITHRDLSLRHVLNTFDSPPSIKLVGFGLPTLRCGNGGPTSPFVALTGSTLEYAAPEVLRGELSGREDESWDKNTGGWTCPMEGKPSWRQSDVYSYTVLLMELLLEERPWDGELPIYVMNAVAKQNKRPFKVEDVRVFGKRSPELEALVLEAWHDDPTKRPSAQRLKTRLQQIFNSSTPAST